MRDVLLEVCVDDAPGLAAAVAGGADRIELCAALSIGGLTPSPALMAEAARSPLPVFAMIRPRAGDFVYDATEADQMLAEIDAARAAGLAGIVIGANRPGGELDAPLLARLMAAAEGLSVTLHRAFDLAPEGDEALETAIALGIPRVLTSGRAANVDEGLETIRHLIARAGPRIVVMPGAGVTVANARRLVETGARELHSSCSVSVAEDPPARRFGFAGETRRRTDRETVARLKAAIS